MDKIRRHTKKTAIGIVGGLVVLVGLILVPYPGPGWPVVFIGLAILATEFEFAARFLEKAKALYEDVLARVKKMHWSVQLLLAALTFIITVLTIWLINGFGVLNSIFNLQLDWLISPFFK